MRMEDMVIASVDDHIVEPPDMFDNQLSKSQLANAPQIQEHNGIQIWVWDDLMRPNIGLNAVVGRPKNEWGMEPQRFDHMRKAAYDVDARVDDMNANGNFASLGFPTFPGFHGALFVERAQKDPKNAYEVLQAYNNWHIDEWCGKHPTRFIPLALIPYWNVEDTVAEIERVLDKGCRSVSFASNPAGVGLPGIHRPEWEPLVGDLRPRRRHAQLPHRVGYPGSSSLGRVANRGMDHGYAHVHLQCGRGLDHAGSVPALPRT